MILGQIAEQVCWLAGTGARATAPNDVGLLPPRLQHRTLHVPRPGRPPAVLTLHVHPVELLRDMDVVVSPSNIHFGLPEMYKSSVAASLRRAGAVRDDAGDVVADPVHDELLAWRAHHGVLHRPVRPGTVAPTGPGALAARGIRRLHHAAVAVPRPGTNDYDATPQDVAAAAARVLVLTAQESAAYDPPLRTVCFPLLGSGRGGLPVESSVSALWSALAPPARARTAPGGAPSADRGPGDRGARGAYRRRRRREGAGLRVNPQVNPQVMLGAVAADWPRLSLLMAPAALDTLGERLERLRAEGGAGAPGGGAVEEAARAVLDALPDEEASRLRHGAADAGRFTGPGRRPCPATASRTCACWCSTATPWWGRSSAPSATGCSPRPRCRWRARRTRASSC
ncbi:hypothetical protein ACFQ60_23515 [Streptomyces zhihengii]